MTETVARFTFVVEGDAEALTLAQEDGIEEAKEKAEIVFRGALPEGFRLTVEGS